MLQMNYTTALAVLCSRFTFRLPPELQGPGELLVAGFAGFRVEASACRLSPKCLSSC